MSKKALIFTHQSNEGAACFVPVLQARGFNVDERVTPRAGLADVDVLVPDLLMVMGGAPGVYNAPDYPFLQREIELVRQRIDAGKPVLGICLGSQIIAAALGADVYLGDKGRECGWLEIELQDGAQGHPVRHLCAPNARVFQFHKDTFGLPDGAKLLASSPMYPNQAFEYGGHALGLQCHPEVDEDFLQEWFVMLASLVTGPEPVISLETLRADTQRYAPAMNAGMQKFLNEWLEKQGL